LFRLTNEYTLPRMKPRLRRAIDRLPKGTGALVELCDQIDIATRDVLAGVDDDTTPARAKEIEAEVEHLIRAHREIMAKLPKEKVRQAFAQLQSPWIRRYNALVSRQRPAARGPSPLTSRRSSTSSSPRTIELRNVSQSVFGAAIHEAGHAVVAIENGLAVERLVVHANGSGEAHVEFDGATAMAELEVNVAGALAESTLLPVAFTLNGTDLASAQARLEALGDDLEQLYRDALSGAARIIRERKADIARLAAVLASAGHLDATEIHEVLGGSQ
jgi:hypothetical protein